MAANRLPHCLCPIERKRAFIVKVKGGMSREKSGGGSGQESGAGTEVQGSRERASGMKLASLGSYPGLSTSSCVTLSKALHFSEPPFGGLMV